jgi:hypothetical protein
MAGSLGAKLCIPTLGADAAALQSQFNEKTMDHPAADQSGAFRLRNFYPAAQ